MRQFALAVEVIETAVEPAAAFGEFREDEFREHLRRNHIAEIALEHVERLSGKHAVPRAVTAVGRQQGVDAAEGFEPGRVNLPGQPLDFVRRIVEGVEQPLAGQQGTDDVQCAAEVGAAEVDLSVPEPVGGAAELFDAAEPRRSGVERRADAGGVAVLPASRREPDRVFAVVPLAADHCGKDSGTEIQPAGRIRVREIRTAFQVLLLNGQNLLGRNREVVHRHVMERIRIDGPGRRFDPDMDHRAAEFAAPPRLPVRGEAVPVETGKVSHDSHPFVFHIIPDFVRPVLPSSVVYCCILRSDGPENCRSRRSGSISRKPVPPLSYRYGFPVAGSGGSSGIRRCSFAVPAANSVRPGKARQAG